MFMDGKLAYLHNKRIYSRQWAESTVARFCQMYARAAETEMAVFQIDKVDLALFLRHNDPFWHLFTDLVKKDDKYYQSGNRPPSNVLHMRIALREKILVMHPDRMGERVHDHLTHLIKCANIEEPSISMGPGVANSGVRTFPLSPSRGIEDIPGQMMLGLEV